MTPDMLPSDPQLFRTARWIGSGETPVLVPGTFLLLRKTFTLDRLPAACHGRILADTQYRLWVNGRYVQSGPAPADPRWPDVDPLDLSAFLRPGGNVVAVEVAYLGASHNGGGDNQWIAGVTCALICEVLAEDGRPILATDESWECVIDPAHPPCPRRNYGRFLRETFDGRKEYIGWKDTTFAGLPWPRARVLSADPNRPLCAPHNPKHRLSLRSIPFMAERDVSPREVIASGRLEWRCDPEHYFTYVGPEQPARLVPDGTAGTGPAVFPLRANPGDAESALVTFDFGEEIAAYPVVEVEAREGTVIDLIFSEKPLGPEPLWLEGFRNSIRMICREGRTSFAAFDYEAIKYLQLVVRNAAGTVTLHRVGARQRWYPFRHDPDLTTADSAFNAVFNAGINTLRNVMQDYAMDNVRRERGAYGSWGPAMAYATGDSRLADRCNRLLAQSASADGWVFDGWPGRVRTGELEGVFMKTGATPCLIDCTFGNMILHLDTYLFTGDAKPVADAYPIYADYMKWLLSRCGTDGLLPERPSMWHVTWVDHMGWGPVGDGEWSTDKTLPLNLLLYHVFTTVFPEMERAAGVGNGLAAATVAAGGRIAGALKARYWDEGTGLFLNNLPAFRESGKYRHAHEMSVALSLLCGLVPEEAVGNSVRLLASYPEAIRTRVFPSAVETKDGSLPVHMGIAHPVNARWRWLALSKYGRGDAIVRDVLRRWTRLISVREGNTLSEGWELADGRVMCYGDHDRIGVRCQGNLAIPELVYRCILGLAPREPGWKTFSVNPQLGDLAWITGTVWTPSGPVRLEARRLAGGRVGCQLSHPPELRPAVAGHVALES